MNFPSNLPLPESAARFLRWALIALTLISLSALSASADAQSGPTSTTLEAAQVTPPTAAWRASLPRDPDSATRAYLDRLPAAARERSNAYFEGGYWLELWDSLYGIGVAMILLQTRWAARVRDCLKRGDRLGYWRIGVLAAAYTLVTTLLEFPLTVYEGYFRQHQFGLLNQTFTPWLKEQGIGLGISLITMSLLIATVYTVLRKFPKTWPAWVTGVILSFMTVGIVIAPVYLAPLFNTYTRLEDGPVRASLLALAHGNGIPAQDIYAFDASKQSNRISANVSGLLGTMRISLNDNALKRLTLPQIRGVTGHEMGHYVLHHIYKMLIDFTLIVAALCYLVRSLFTRAQARWGSRWGITGLADPAGLPLLLGLFTILMFLIHPLTNSIIRMQEAEADLFGVNASREPDGMADAFLLLTEYRKPEPGGLEEMIFFDHPSARTRIHMMMTWKSENWPQP